jgi:3-oxoacyl-[acyl-carrier-protein] synthase-1
MEIVATGMVCSVGLTAAASCAALRAKVAKFDELPYSDNNGEPIVGAAVPGLDPRLTRRARLLELLAPALSDILASAHVDRTERIPLLVGLAEPERAGGGGDWAESMLADVTSRVGTSFDRERSATVCTGHTAGFEGLRLARELLRDPAVPACLVCGVDSFINARSLLALERVSRLKTPDNSDGVIPGEAAACVLVVRPEGEPRDGCVARVAGLGFARESATLLNDEPFLGAGLASAARAALAEPGWGLHEVDYRISDVGGESYAFKEQSLVVSRLMRVRRECLPLWHSADSIGDTGAASGVVQLVMALHAYRKRYAPGRRAICFTSSVAGPRAVAVLERRVAGSAGRTGTGPTGRLAVSPL